MIRKTLACAAALVLAAALSGCFGGNDDDCDTRSMAGAVVSVEGKGGPGGGGGGGRGGGGSRSGGSKSGSKSKPKSNNTKPKPVKVDGPDGCDDD